MKIRILSLACYLGLAPEIGMATTRWSRNQTLQRHIRQGLGLNLLWLLYLIIIGIGYILENLLGILLSVYFPGAAMDLYSSLANRFPVHVDVFVAMLALALLACLGITGIIRACCSSDVPIPLIERITQNKKAMTISAVGGFVFQFLFVTGIAIVLRGDMLARPHPGPASVYMLYEEEINFPRWVYAAGLYPTSEIATVRWGPGSAVVEPLTRSNIEEAVQNGRIVILATHGGHTRGTVPLSNSPKDYSPSDIEKSGGAGSDLQFVYIAGCFGGAKDGEWKQSLAPADVILFNRFSWELEHVLWLWFEAPILVSKMR